MDKVTQQNAAGAEESASAAEEMSAQAEQMTMDFVAPYCQKIKPPLCGNSVWQDRIFLIKHMPKLEKLLHYRNIDVSSIKELVKRWYPSLPSFKKQKAHLALDDIMESIEELKYYRQHVFT
jgi:oligoribonuclease